LTCEALSAALSLGSEVVAVHVCLEDERAAEFSAAWRNWHPRVPLVLLLALFAGLLTDQDPR
ncbi:hypothetical protein, partial [Nocardia cyriacigeorgica]|uniref:hypothetical protein n=1 Tax=Nocardia cyriacigeorgica TaxID=135487 RepID=UPI002454F583